MKLPKGWKMLVFDDRIELQNEHILITVFHAKPSDIRIIDKRNPEISHLREEIENIFADAEVIKSDAKNIIKELKEVIKRK